MKLSSYKYEHRTSCLNTLKDTSCNYKNSCIYKNTLLSDYNTRHLMLSNFKLNRARSFEFYRIKQTTLSEYSDQVVNFIGKINISPLRFQ